MKTGYRPSMNEALHGKCCECMANYADGKADCEHTNCPLYSRHKYRKLRPRYDWVFDSVWSRKYSQERKAIGMTREQYLKKIFGPSIKIPISKLLRAKCFQCNGDFTGGMPHEDCNIRDCAIYFWMPYRTQLPIYDWMFDLDSSKHRMVAKVKGYIINVKTEYGVKSIIDRDKYISDTLPLCGKIKPKRTRNIICV